MTTEAPRCACGTSGISIGGMVGMWLASGVPERIGRFVLCCTSAEPSEL
jgi:pimeloyl-ACP methyl ester carboxylesterase